MNIETERLRIRDLVSSDAEPFIEMASDGSLLDIGFDPDCGSWMKDWVIEAQALEQKDDPRADYLAYVIEDRETGTVLGSVGCSYYTDLEKVGATYFIGAQFRGKGYAPEALRAYVRYFFEHYAEDELIATIREANVPSWRVTEKAGFTLTEKRMYKDIDDEEEKLYRFYAAYRNEVQG